MSRSDVWIETITEEAGETPLKYDMDTRAGQGRLDRLDRIGGLAPCHPVELWQTRTPHPKAHPKAHSGTPPKTRPRLPATVAPAPAGIRAFF